jgi:hypothetical protein
VPVNAEAPGASRSGWEPVGHINSPRLVEVLAAVLFPPSMPKAVAFGTALPAEGVGRNEVRPQGETSPS